MRDYVAGQRLAAEMSARHAPPPPPAAIAFEQALELLDLAAERCGWPIPEDAGREREVASVRRTWSRLIGSARPR